MATKEEYAIVLDFLPNGYPDDPRPMFRKTPVVQAIGKTHFALLELVPKKDVFLKPGDEVYIGEGKREQIHHVIGKLEYSKLTGTAQTELEALLNKLIDENEKKFISFFNNAQPLTTRMHQLELLPGLGKKHMWMILEAREEKPFESFEDLKKRVHLMPDPKKLVYKRILEEMQEKDKHRIFVG